MEMPEIESWTLLEDGKTIRKEYDHNAREVLTLSDGEGNSKEITVIIQNIDKIAPVVNRKYSTREKTNQAVFLMIEDNLLKIKINFL